MIYTFVFVGCRTTVWVHGIFGEYSDDTEVSHGSPRRRRFRPGLCCYNHSGGGGFGLLTTCGMVYIEAVEACWSETILNVGKLYGHHSYCSGCELQQVCEYLPVTIKESLRHLRNVRLPILKEGRQTCGDTNWTPFLLGHLPKLVSCGFSGFGHRNIHLAGGLRVSYRFTVPDSQNIAQCYYGVGRFEVEDCESPAAFLESTIGVQRSCGITMLSMAIGGKPRPCPDNYEFRVSSTSTYTYTYMPYGK